jgi:head-tail adaptor
MQNKTFIKTAVEENVTNIAVPKVIGEWYSGRYSTVKDNWPKTNETAEQTNFGKELRYPAYFPMNSVTKPFRDPGIIYSTNYDSYSASYGATDTKFGVDRVLTYNWGMGDPVRNDNRLYPRMYLVDRDNRFQYWISSARTLAKADAFKTRGEFSCTNQDSSRALQFEIEYTASITANKLQIRFNTHIGNPQGVFFSIKKGGVWTQVASSLNVPNNGILEVYRTYIPGDQTTPGTWTTTPSYYTDSTKNSIDIDGIRVGITSMQRTLPVSASTEAAANASVEIVEFNPKLAIDLTERTSGYNARNEISNNEYSDKLIGNISSNTGSIEFINDDGYFDTSTTTGPLTGKLDENVEFTVDLIYDAAIGGTLAERTVRQLTMLSDAWSSTGEESVTVQLIDYSKVLQEAKAQETVVDRIPAFAAIWLLCDGIGFNRVSIDRSDNRDGEEDLMMEYFWAKPEQTVWELIQDIAKSFQIAVFFNEFGTKGSDKEISVRQRFRNDVSNSIRL